MSSIAGLSDSAVERILRIRWERARLDPVYFMRHFAYSLDQHDAAHPIKAFPAERPHIQHLVRLWQDNPCLVICKSRQMFCTWLFTALALWDAMFHRGKLVMLQSKRQDDAIGSRASGDGLLGRAGFVLDHIPGGEILVPRVRSTFDRIEFPDNNSTLWAIPQGADIIRQRTASGVLSDEAAFQEEFSEAYVAARPCIRGGGWFCALSTAHPGFFQNLYEGGIAQ